MLNVFISKNMMAYSSTTIYNWMRIKNIGCISEYFPEYKIIKKAVYITNNNEEVIHLILEKGTVTE